MSAATSGSSFNIPNAITVARGVLAIAVFALMSFPSAAAMWTASALFALTAGTDWLDGFLARRWNQITVFGRIADPLVDKILVCGTYIYLAAEHRALGHVFGIVPWVATLVLARELLVTAMRSAVEGKGGDFSSQWSGKVKLVVQAIAATMGCASIALSRAGAPPILFQFVYYAMVAATVVVTVYSGIAYAMAAMHSGKKDGVA